MEKIKKLLEFLSPLPAWLRVFIVALVTAVVSVCVLMSASSCGITRAVVRGTAEGNVTEIKITTNNQTSVDASPNVSLSSKPN